MIQLIDVLAAGVVDSAGDPVANGIVYFYQAGTTTLTTVYSDYELESPISNPATLDAAGRLTAYYDGRVKLIITTSAGVAVKTHESVGVGDAEVSASVSSSLAGSGLEENGDLLDVSVDDETITIDDDALEVKNGGITPIKFNASAFLTRPGASWNIGLATATTTNAGDSIKVTGADGSALSATNPGYIALPGDTAGTLEVFQIVADVTLLITGAPWGLGTKGDFTDIPIRLYGINDNGTFVLAASNKGRALAVASSACSTTPSAVNTQSEFLSKTSVSSGTWPCAEFAWFLGDFDDTGGAAEDLWVVQTGAGEMGIGTPAPTVTDWTSFTPTGSWDTNVTYTGTYRLDGGNLEMSVLLTMSGNPNSADLTVNYPTGFKFDNTKLPLANVLHCGLGAVQDSTARYPVIVAIGSTNVALFVPLASGTYSTTTASTSQIDELIPISTWNTRLVSFTCRVPVLGHSA